MRFISLAASGFCMTLRFNPAENTLASELVVTRQAGPEVLSSIKWKAFLSSVRNSGVNTFILWPMVRVYTLPG